MELKGLRSMFAGKAGSSQHWCHFTYSTYNVVVSIVGIGSYMAEVSMVSLVGDGTDVETGVLSGLIGLEITEFIG